MEIIGISGYARSGKDEAANVLVNEFGFIRVSFADKLREVLYALDPICGHYYDSKNPSFVTVQEVIDKYTWNGYKETEYGNEIRRLLQRLGTEAGRQTLWDNIWVDAAFAGLDEDASVVIADARFENEAEAVVSRGGEMWRVTRKGVGPINTHASETGLDLWSFDEYIRNDGTLEEYQNQIRNLYNG